MGLSATIGQSMTEAGSLERFAAANSSSESGLKEAVRFTASRREYVARFQQKTPEASALVTVFLGRGCETLMERLGRDDGGMSTGILVLNNLLAFAEVVLVGGEHYVGRVEGEVVELGVAWTCIR